MQNKTNNILPFYRISLGYTVLYLLLLVVLPISNLFYHINSLSFEKILSTISNARVISAFQLTFISAAMSATVSVILGFFISWTLARYEFKGKGILDIFIDLPIALPTAIAGLSLAYLYSTDSFWGDFLHKIGIEVAFTRGGIIVALIFIGLPLTIRTIEPVIRELDLDIEDAAYSLGASNLSVFWRIYLPSFAPAILSAFSIAFARGLSEYGAIIFISSNIPKKSEVVSLLIYSKIEQFDFNEATVIAIVMLSIAFIFILVINTIAKRVFYYE